MGIKETLEREMILQLEEMPFMYISCQIQYSLLGELPTLINIDKAVSRSIHLMEQFT